MRVVYILFRSQCGFWERQSCGKLFFRRGYVVRGNPSPKRQPMSNCNGNGVSPEPVRARSLLFGTTSRGEMIVGAGENEGGKFFSLAPKVRLWERPYSSLDDQTPVEFAQRSLAAASATLRQPPGCFPPTKSPPTQTPKTNQNSHSEWIKNRGQVRDTARDCSIATRPQGTRT